MSAINKRTAAAVKGWETKRAKQLEKVDAQIKLWQVKVWKTKKGKK